MTTLVLDASVVVKWIFADHPQESHVPQALRILQQIKNAHVTVVQPPHWLAEVVAVMARLDPRSAREVESLLYAMEFPVADDEEVYRWACDLAIKLRQHVFDTLYHAVALTTSGALLVTADEQYFRKASHLGQIVRLIDFRLAHPT